MREGKPVSITPKAFHLLKILVENHGRIAEKEKLITQIWADCTVEEGNLAFTVRTLRKTLGDEAGNPKFIETVPRRGYRFIAEVKEHFEDFTAQSLIDTSASSTALNRSKRIYILAVLLLFFAGSFVVGSQYLRKMYARSALSAPILSAAFNSEKFSVSGNVFQAVISPDGKYAAYVDKIGGKYGVWLRQLESSENIQIVPPSDDFYNGMAFSHDGNSLYFMREPQNAPRRTAIYRVMTFGGIPVKIIDNTEGWISISPDDKQISFVRCEQREEDFCSLFAADVDGKNERKILTRAQPIRIADNQFSPDGKSIAFAVGQSRNGSNEFRLMKVNLESGEESEITAKRFFNIRSLKWLPEGEGLLFTALETLDGRIKVWQVSATGEIQPVTKDAANYAVISLDKNAERMLATHVSNNFRIYLSPNDKSDSPRMLIAARQFTFAPDNRILYSADDNDIWAINADGGGQRQLTNNSYKDFAPQVSPDNRFIFFTSNRSGTNQIWRMNADGTNQIQLTAKESGYSVFVTPDGKWLYYESGLSQTLWKVSTEGGEEIQVSENRMPKAAFSPDGNLVAYFFRDKELKIAVMSLADKKQIKVLNYGDGKSHAVNIAWSNDNRTINFVTNADSKNILWQQSLDEDQPRFVADLGDEKINDFALSPDGNGFAFVRGKWMHDAVLIDGLK